MGVANHDPLWYLMPASIISNRLTEPEFRALLTRYQIDTYLFERGYKYLPG